MTLQFNPGAYASIYEQAQARRAQNDQQRNQTLNNSINAIPQAFLGYQQQQMARADQEKQDKYNQLMLGLKFGEAGYDPQAGMSALDASPQVSQQPEQMGQSPQPGPWSNAEPQGTPSAVTGGMYSNPPAPAMSPIVAAHKQMLASKNPFERPNVDYSGIMSSAKSGNYSPMFALPKNEQANAMKAFEYDQNRSDRESRDKQLTAYQQAMLNSNQGKLDATMGEKSNQFNQKEWDKIVKEADPMTTTGRSGLGMAAKADFNANRALTTLSKPIVTNQEAGNVMADIASIYQGGSATQYGMSHQGYTSLYGKLQGALQSVSGNPQDSLPAPIKQRLVSVLNEMKAQNKAVMKQQLDHLERSQPKVISNYQNEWKGIRQNLEGGIAGGPAQDQTPQITSQQEYDQLPMGTSYMWNGVPHVKGGK